jgi:hypothetical protein
MIVMIPTTDLLILHPLKPDTHRADIQQRGLRILTPLQAWVTLDMGTPDLNTHLITGMAIMDPDTQATMDIGITDRGISGQTWHFVEFAMMDKTDDLSA